MQDNLTHYKSPEPVMLVCGPSRSGVGLRADTPLTGLSLPLRFASGPLPLTRPRVATPSEAPLHFPDGKPSHRIRVAPPQVPSVFAAGVRKSSTPAALTRCTRLHLVCNDSTDKVHFPRVFGLCLHYCDRQRKLPGHTVDCLQISDRQ